MPFISHSQPKAEVRTAPLLNGLRQIGTVEAHDADDDARNLTAWEQSCDQIAPGQFHRVLAQLQMPQMQVFLEQTSQAVRQSHEKHENDS